MSREDYISKLFRENADKLDEQPSHDLWSRISGELDRPEGSSEQEDLPKFEQVSPKSAARPRGGLMQLAPYFAAASIVAAVLLASPLFFEREAELKTAHQMAESSDRGLLAEEMKLESESEALPLNAEEQEAQFEAQEKEQAKKIFQAAQEKAPKPLAADDFDDIKLSKEEASDDIVILSPEEKVVEEEPLLVQEEARAEFDYPLPKMSPPIARNYANAPAADPSLAPQIEALQEQNAVMTAPKEAEQMNKRGLVSKRAKEKSRKKVVRHKIHPRIQLFEWLLGEYEDQTPEAGTSIERWRLLGPNVIEGIAVLKKGEDKIFEERMRIFYDEDLRQVFLDLPLDDSRLPARYMLSQFDTERIIFEQNDQSDLPNKIILQPSLQGYTLIILQERGFLKSGQQQYLQHRNRLSNVRAIRDLKLKE